MIGNKLRAKSLAAFSLIEIIVSVALFSVIILSATEIFKLVIDSQRNALATQNVQESLKYFLEVMSKELRMAQKDQGFFSEIPDEEIFVVSSDAHGDSVLTFRNYYNQRVTYSLSPDPIVTTSKRFKISRTDGSGGTLTDFISPSKISIDELHFVLNEDATHQPLLTINLRAHALDQAQFKSEMVIQTSITSRFYK